MPANKAPSSQALDTWMIERLRESVRGVHFMAAVAVAAVTFIFYLGTELETLLLWAGLLLTCEALLGFTMLAAMPGERWLRLYSPLHLAACAGWGTLPVIFFQDLPGTYQSTFTLVLAAAAVVSQPTMSYMPRLYIAGMVLMLLPTSIMLFMKTGPVPLALGLLLVVGMVLLTLRTRQDHARHRERAREALSLREAHAALREHQDSLRAERHRADQAGKWDPVTGVHSQNGFLEALETRSPTPGTMAVCIRVAGFKYVNMAFGHAIGDEVLREIAARILDLTGEPGRVCRTGGGEFLAVLEDAPRSLEEQLTRLCDEPCLTSRGRVTVNAYIGLSRLEADDDPQAAIHSAIHAAEDAKTAGDKQVRTLAPADRASQRNRSLMRFALRDALDKHELSLVYQPQHRLGDRALTGFEALLRWESPIFGAVGPREFIPVAEEAGLIPAVGAWVCRHALAEFREHFADTSHSLSLNVSLFQLEDEDFVDMVGRELAANRIAANRLTLEITESTFMASPAMIGKRLAALREMGVRIALDDFGTGYSSLSYLTQIPLDEVKIDQAFVKEIADNTVSHTLVTSLLQICRALDIQAVIEGVEYRRQMEALRDFPDVLIQGFVFSRPVSIRGAASYREGFAEST